MLRLRLAFQTAVAICTIMLSVPVAAAEQVDSTADPGHPKAASVTTLGTFRVERFGAGSPAMIFIPGLSCGSWIWDDVVARYGGRHALYLVTLAGFDGLPAPGGPALDGADASLLELIESEKLDRPILVGHSLGGFLALRFGTEHPALIRGIVSVDGTPVLPPFADSTPVQRATTADAIAAQIRVATPDEYAAQQKTTLATMITAPADVSRIATLSARSDPKAVAAYASDLFRADLRPVLPKLTVPTLEIAPVPTIPAPYEGPQAANASMADREAGYKQFYDALFAGAPNVTVVTVANAKHFVMVDQPQALYDAVTAFVGKLSP